MTMWLPDLRKRDQPIYRMVAERLAEDIENGRLRAGQRLPTHRELADALGVTVGTITRGYAEAERRGLVRGETGRGTFVAKGLPEAVPMGLMEQYPSATIDMSLNLPMYAGDPDLAPALEAIAGSPGRADLLRYGPAAGSVRHRTAGVRWIARFGLQADPDDIVVCAGAQHAMTVVFASIASPGDLVLTESLTYPGMKALASLLNLRLEPVRMDDEGVVPESFEAACKTGRARALYCIPTLQNPTTATQSIERRRVIARIAQHHGVALVEDDIHGLLAEKPAAPIVSFAREAGFFIASTSKSLAGGLRVSYLVAPPGMAGRLSRCVSATTWMTSPLSAEIAALWIDDGTADEVIRRKREEARARQEIAARVLAGHPFRSSPTCYHLWLELPSPWRGEQFAFEALRRGVSVTPAETFLVGRSPTPRAVRLALGSPASRQALQQGLCIISEMLETAPASGTAIV